jgi:hypothetical protein
MVRLRVREVAERYGVKRSVIGHLGRLSLPTMNKVWNDENITVRLDILDRVADGLTAALRERGIQDTITVHDLIEVVKTE